MEAVRAMVTSAGLSSGQPAALEYCRTSPGGHLIVACRHDRVTGVSYAVSFGPTGWIGNVAVHPDARGQGHGTAVSEAALARLRRAGVTTMLLTATEMGRPIYERLGFADDGVCYGIWTRGQQPHATADGQARVGSGCTADALRQDARADGEARVGPGRIADALRQDAEATGEDRGSFLGTFAGRVRTLAGQAGTGYRIALPWGRGPVVASGPDAARALVTDMLRAGLDQSLSFPESNLAATELATALGFRLTRRCTRMRLGPPVPRFRPERIFNVFSLAVG
jgi:Acetyltransferase (GNAT) domain/Acetyltransferase (GNAT) family